MSDKKRWIIFVDKLKGIGDVMKGIVGPIPITVFIALITGSFQYTQFLRQESDKNFRAVVEQLSSQNVEERLAAASNMGTFIKGKYYDQAVDILTNRLSTELDYNVLRAIRGSLQEIKKKDYEELIGKLLNIERNFFLQEYALQKWMNDAKKELEDSKREYSEMKELETSLNLNQLPNGVIFPTDLKDKIRYDTNQKLLIFKGVMFIQEKDTLLNLSQEAPYREAIETLFQRVQLFKENMSEVYRILLDNLKEVIKRKQEIYLDREKNFRKLELHKQVNADFITIFLEETKSFPMKLEFYQNGLNNTRLIGLNLSNSKFVRCALSNSTIEETTFDGSIIEDSVFTFSIFTKSSFKNCKIITASLFDQISSVKGVSFSNATFKDVFFAGSDLTGATFIGAKGLDPRYFYKAKNIDKAKFDDPEFKKKVDEITEVEFKGYVNNSELGDYRKKELFQTLERLDK